MMNDFDMNFEQFASHNQNILIYKTAETFWLDVFR